VPPWVAFLAFDPNVRFPRFHPTQGDETIGNVYLIEGEPQSGQWQWSMTVSLPGPRYGEPTSGIETSRGAAGRRVVEVYRHYLSVRPEEYLRYRRRAVGEAGGRVVLLPQQAVLSNWKRTSRALDIQ
jgi:hypothetical protein